MPIGKCFFASWLQNRGDSVLIAVKNSCLLWCGTVLEATYCAYCRV